MQTAYDSEEQRQLSTNVSQEASFLYKAHLSTGFADQSVVQSKKQTKQWKTTRKQNGTKETTTEQME